MRVLIENTPEINDDTFERWHGQALVICLIAGSMTLVDASIVNVALPSMQRSLRMSPAEVSWSVAGYALTFGLTLIPAGRLGDEYGRRKLLLIGLSLFAVTGIVCGAAPNATVLMVARLCRGVAAGLLAPQVIGLMQQMYSGPKRGAAFGYFGATVSLSAAVGPLLGGIILRAFGAAEGWRFVFYLSVPILVLTLALAFRVLPADHRTGVHGLDLKPLTIRSYSVGAVVATALYAGFTGIFLVITMFLQQGLNYSPLEAAASTSIFTVGSAGAAVVSGHLVHRMGRALVVIGSALARLALILMAQVAHYWTGPDAAAVLAAPLLLSGRGCGLVISANQTLTLNEIARANAGVAAGIYEAGQRVGMAIGTALSTALYFGELTTTGDYHAPVGLGLSSPSVFVGVAFLIGTTDILWPVHRKQPRGDAHAAT
jgi:MFS family permease